MKKFFILSLALSLVLSGLLFVGCGESSATKGRLDLLTYIPNGAAGLVEFDFGRFAQLEIFDTLVKDNKKEEVEKDAMFKNYQDFIDKTGVDPQKDIHGLVMAFYGDIEVGKGNQNMVAVANMNYDKEKLLNLMKEKGEKLTEEKYGEFTLYKTKKDDMVLSFLSPNLATVGKSDVVKKVVDLFEKKGENIYKSESLKPFIKQFKDNSIFSFVFALPENMKKVQGEGSPVKVDLSKAEAVLGFADYNDDVLNGEIVVVSHNEEGNTQAVTTLNGLKGMGAMAGPEVAELLNNITLTSSADEIKLAFAISKGLMEKLKAKADEKKENPVE